MSNPIAFVIEDDADTASIFSAAMETAGYHIEVISDGQLAITRLNETVPSLVALDLHLPGKSGREVLQYIRQNDATKDVPVILTTADQRMASELDKDANIVLIKPISFNQLSLLSRRLHPTSRS